MAEAAQVKQKSGEILFNAKAWNGRILCQWLADTLPLAARGFDLMYDGGRLTLTCHSLTLVWNCLVGGGIKWKSVSPLPNYLYIKLVCTSIQEFGDYPYAVPWMVFLGNNQPKPPSNWETFANLIIPIPTIVIHTP